MTQSARSRPAGKLYFHDQAGFHPADSAIGRIAGEAQVGGRRSGDTIQARAHRRQFLFGVTGADATGVVPGTGLVAIAKVQSAETGPAARGRRPAEHHKLLAFLAFQFQPVVAPTASVWRIRPLADDALQP